MYNPNAARLAMIGYQFPDISVARTQNYFLTLPRQNLAQDLEHLHNSLHRKLNEYIANPSELYFTDFPNDWEEIIQTLEKLRSLNCRWAFEENIISKYNTFGNFLETEREDNRYRWSPDVPIRPIRSGFVQDMWSKMKHSIERIHGNNEFVQPRVIFDGENILSTSTSDWIVHHAGDFCEGFLETIFKPFQLFKSVYEWYYNGVSHFSLPSWRKLIPSKDEIKARPMYYAGVCIGIGLYIYTATNAIAILQSGSVLLKSTIDFVGSCATGNVILPSWAQSWVPAVCKFILPILKSYLPCALEQFLAASSLAYTGFAFGSFLFNSDK